MSSFQKQEQHKTTNSKTVLSSGSKSDVLDNSSSAGESNKLIPHKLLTFRKNCSICGCIVYDTFGDQYNYYCYNHTKYDTAWQS